MKCVPDILAWCVVALSIPISGGYPYKPIIDLRDIESIDYELSEYDGFKNDQDLDGIMDNDSPSDPRNSEIITSLLQENKALKPERGTSNTGNNVNIIIFNGSARASKRTQNEDSQYPRRGKNIESERPTTETALIIIFITLLIAFTYFCIGLSCYRPLIETLCISNPQEDIDKDEK
ncbi:hypothetical protein TCAL_15431 [Tigriopus californicus]|uniref:Uncharacterized protein n=1 Tax=Tigriopus californicus TaxID=6832 RepID=A0A553PRB5_TIGCA|nr:uncharacterized protein LOC131892408 [Tigriopus californicus]TRY80233.1 hypothetical protein TCAL_15431 [Tigriopus californicus]